MPNSARDYASCHMARNTLVIFLANNVQNLRLPAKSLNLNFIDHLLDLLKRKACAQQLNLRELMWVIHQVCAAIPQQYIYRHIFFKEYTVHLAVDAIPGGCKYWNEIKYDMIWFCSFCFKGVHVNPLIKVCSHDQNLKKFCFIY